MSSICYIQYSERTFLYTRQPVLINIYICIFMKYKIIKQIFLLKPLFFPNVLSSSSLVSYPEVISHSLTVPHKLENCYLI